MNRVYCFLLFTAISTPAWADEPDLLPASDIRPEAARTFPAKAQPILMNACARCHCQPELAGKFLLSRATPGYTNPKLTQRNLLVAAAFIDPADPERSPLLTYAVTPHGGLNVSPIQGRGHPAFKNLRAWALAAREAPRGQVGLESKVNNPSAVSQSQPVLPAAPLPGVPVSQPVQRVGFATDRGTVPSVGPTVTPFASPEESEPAEKKEVGQSKVMPFEQGGKSLIPGLLPEYFQQPPAEGADPYDPAPFNSLPK